MSDQHGYDDHDRHDGYETEAPEGGGYPPTGESPPTEASDFVPVKPPESWPTVIGVLSIIFAVLGILQAGCGMVFTLGAPAILNMLPEDPQWDEFRQSLQTVMQGMGWQASAQALELVVAILLLVGGIQLMKRRVKAAATLTLFAWLDLVANTVGAVIAVYVARLQAAAMAEAGMQAQGAPGEAFTLIGAGVGWVLSAIWPVFLLIWFRRQKVRDSMASW